VLTTLLSLAAVLTLLAGAGWERRRRRRFLEDGHVFDCRFRACGRAPRSWRWLRRHWSRRMYARWAGDVLIVRRGPVFDRTISFGAQLRAPGVYLLARHSDRTARIRLIAVRLLVGGSLVEAATSEYARTDLVGPYLAAAAIDLPKAPVPRREI
jgi:hypothetical protein